MCVISHCFIDPRWILETMQESMSALLRSSGLALPPASLPGRFGMGEIGTEAHHWIGCLSRMGQSFWQMPLPAPRIVEEAPGSALSSYAGNPMLLSFDALRYDGVLLPGDLSMLPVFDEGPIDFGPAVEVREAFLNLAARRFIDQTERSPLLHHAFSKFCEVEAFWLDDWALFATLRQVHDRKPWTEWPAGLASRESDALAVAVDEHSVQIAEHKALQFLFFRQWHRLRACAHEHRIALIADLPESMPRVSADHWLSPGGLDWETRVRAAARLVDQVHLPGLPQDLAAGAELPLIYERLESVAHEGWKGIEQVWGSPVLMAVCSLPCVLDDEAADMAAWRFNWDDLSAEKQLRLRLLTERSGRR